MAVDLENKGWKENGPTVTMDALTMALLISAVLYVFCGFLAMRKLAVLNRYRPELSTQKVLILSVALVSVVRIMTILGVAAMNIANVRAHYKLSPQSIDDNRNTRDQHQLFYDKSMTVLFDLPNCMVVSTYVLLTLVWAECFVKARLHTESAATLKKTWLIYFMIFNSLLYTIQLTLYGSLFLAPPTKVVRSVIYIGITGINFTAVLLVLVFYLYLNIRFSGFPYRSQRLRVSLTRVSKVMTLWSLTRVVWGIATLLVFVYKVELLQDSNTPFWSFVVLLLMFFVCEILPIFVMLDYSYLSLVGLERIEIRWEEEEDEGSISAPSDSNLPRSTPNPARSVRWRDDDTLTDPLLTPGRSHDTRTVDEDEQ
jgi:hypothetical protein